MWTMSEMGPLLSCSQREKRLKEHNSVLPKEKFIKYRVSNMYASRDEMVKYEHGTDPRLQGTFAQACSNKPPPFCHSADSSQRHRIINIVACIAPSKIGAKLRHGTYIELLMGFHLILKRTIVHRYFGLQSWRHAENRLGSGGDGVRDESTYVLSDMVRFSLKSWFYSNFYFWLDVHAAQEREGNPKKKDLEKKRSEAENTTFCGAAKLRTLRCSSRAETRHEYVSTCLFSTGMVAQVWNFVFQVDCLGLFGLQTHWSKTRPNEK